MPNIWPCDELDRLIADMQEEADMTSPRVGRVLLAGAEVFRTAYKQAAKENNFRRTGSLIRSVDYNHSVDRAAKLLKVEIYPQGTNLKGQRYAEIAYILHWGTTSTAAQKRRNANKKYRDTPGIPRTLWVDRAEAIANETVVEAMRRAWEEDNTL